MIIPVKSYSQNKKNTKKGSILADFLCIIGQKLKWVAGLTGCPKNPEIFLVAIDIYTQPWTKLQNKIQNLDFLEQASIQW